MSDSAYTKFENTFCLAEGKGNYGNVAEAIRACDNDNECRFVSDFGCKNPDLKFRLKRIWLCYNNAPIAERAPSGACLYEKPGNFLILPTVITKI